MKSNVRFTLPGETNRPCVLVVQELKIVMAVLTPMPSALIAAIPVGLKLASKNPPVPPTRLKLAALALLTESSDATNTAALRERMHPTVSATLDTSEVVAGCLGDLLDNMKETPIRNHNKKLIGSNRAPPQATYGCLQVYFGR